MKAKRSAGLSFYIVLMIIANLVLACIVGRSFIAEKYPEGIRLFKKNSTESTVSASSAERGDRPALPEFRDWFYVVDRHVPAEAEAIYSSGEITGSWKVTIYENGKKVSGDRILLLNADISEEEDGLSVVLDWYSASYVTEAKTEDETSKKDAVLSAGWKSGILTVEDGEYKFTVSDFYRLDGKEYAVGSGKIGSFDVSIGLVRDCQ